MPAPFRCPFGMRHHVVSEFLGVDDALQIPQRNQYLVDTVSHQLASRRTARNSPTFSSFYTAKARGEAADGRKSNLPDLLIISSDDEVEEEEETEEVDGDVGGRATTAAEVSSAFGPRSCPENPRVCAPVQFKFYRRSLTHSLSSSVLPSPRSHAATAPPVRPPSIRPPRQQTNGYAP